WGTDRPTTLVDVDWWASRCYCHDHYGFAVADYRSIIFHGTQPDRSGDHHHGGRPLRIIWGRSVYGQPVATNRSADRIGIGPGCCGGRPCWDSTSACFNLTNLVFGGPWGRCMFWCSGRRERSTCRCPRLCHSCRVCVFCYRHRCPPGAFGGNPSVVAPPSARR